MKKIVFFLASVLIFISCHQEKGSGSGSTDMEMTLVSNDRKLVRSQKMEVLPPPKQEIVKKLIKNGRVSFETESLEKTKSLIEIELKKVNGYISSESQSKQYDRINQYMKVRIPAKSFDSFLETISKGVDVFDVKEINVSDVTERYYDLQSRISNKKKLEQRYAEILKQAKTVKEILDVERELGKLREDIESAEGSLKYLSNQVSLSTLNITFYKKTTFESSFLNKVSNAFKDGFTSIKSFFLFIISIWPFVIILSILSIWIAKRLKRKKSS